MNLPPCIHRGEIADATCRCRSTRVVAPGGIVPLKLCGICPQREGEGPPTAIPDPPAKRPPEHVDTGVGPSDGRAEPECIHRGEQLRRVPCKVGCQASRGVMLPVYACAIHGECTSSKVEPSKPTSLPICSTCKLRTEPAEDRPPETLGALAQWGFH